MRKSDRAYVLSYSGPVTKHESVDLAIFPDEKAARDYGKLVLLGAKKKGSISIRSVEIDVFEIEKGGNDK